MKKFQLNSLTGKMTLRLLKGLGAGIFILLLLYFGGTEIMYPYLTTSERFNNLQIDRINELQDYVDENALSTDDYTELKNWVDERDIDKMTIARGKWLLFDSTYGGEIAIGAKEVTQQTLQKLYTVTFADGDAGVYIDEGYAEKYYDIFLGISIVAGLIVCLSIFVAGMHEDIVYIKCLEKEVSIISQGNLQNQVTISGKDELADLAQGFDQMRLNLIEKERTETEMRLAQEKLVLGMSHDLRTPLTGLMTYMEVLKQQQRDGIVNEEFIDKALDKILQIRGLSDEMFEYFLVTSHKELTIEKPEELTSVFGDYLSEICSLLECNGFVVRTSELEWRPVCVQVNMEYIGRIFNNIISNLEKYADKNEKVQLDILYEDKRIGIRIQNGIAPPDEYVRGTGIGTKNIALMMEQMGGQMQSDISNEMYSITLYFPFADCCDDI